MNNLFTHWPLRPELQQGLSELGFDTPTEVQEAAFLPALDGRDVMVQSRTGSGKTLAFTLPILQRLDPEGDGVGALVVLPTRELCMQVATTIRRLAAPLGMSVAAVYGGGSFQEQLRVIKHGARIVCGTPGRLCDHLDRKTLKLPECHILVLDEADEMLTLGFAEELQRVVSFLPTERQSMLFSATLSDEVKKLAAQSMHDPLVLTVSESMSIPTEIQHVCYEVRQDEKVPALLNVLHADAPERALVFCHTKAETETVVERLQRDGFQAALLNGDLPQPVRTRTLQQFRQGAVRLLVATDVAARGIDVEGITHVVNMAVPRSIETYVHRVGRTGRAGHFGQAVTLVTPRDTPRFRHMLREAGVKLDVRKVPQPQAVRDAVRDRYVAALGTQAPEPRWRRMAASLLQLLPPEDLVALLLTRDPAARAVLDAGEAVAAPERPERKPTRPDKPMGPARRQGRESHEAQMVRLRVNLGLRDRITVGGMVKLVCQATGLPGDALGVITVDQSWSTVDVRGEHVDRVKKGLRGAAWRGREVKVSAPR